MDFFKLFRKAKPVAEVVSPEPKKRVMKIHYGALVAADSVPSELAAETFCLPQPAPGVLPTGNTGMAMDSGIGGAYAYAIQGSMYAEGLQFLGYPYLAELSQRAEYRRPAEILAKEMTRKWIRLQATGDEDKTEKIAAIDAEMKRLGVQSVFRRTAEQDGFFGRSQIYIDVGVALDEQDELKTELRHTPLKIGKGALKGLTVIEPIWTYPNDYNSNDPLHPAFFKPQSWFVMGKQVHASRLLTIISRPVPDLLKPAYSFGGLSLSQMAKPYVDNWLRTRQSVSDLIHSFSVSGLKTNMDSILSGGAADAIRDRAKLFTQTRDNRGMLIVDKDTEEFFNVSTPLSGLDHLQAQAQEHMSSAVGIPMSILLGVTPSGLNATSDGETKQFHQWIEAMQEATFTSPLTAVINIIQLSLFGEIDPAIGFIYEPLWNMDEAELATTRKTEAETDVVLIDAGVISPHEARVRLAGQEDSAYQGLDLNDDPELPQGPDDGGRDDPLAGGLEHLAE